MEIGVTEWQRVKAIFIMRTVMYIPVNSTKIEPMVSEFMFIKMVKLTKAFGEMICKMVLAKKS